MKAALALFLLFAPSAALAATDDSLRESVLRLSAGDAVGARAHAEAAAAAAPGDPRAQEVLARAALAGLDYPAAEAAASAAIARGAAPARLVLRAQARLGRGDFAGAREDAEAALAKSPGSGPAQLCLAASLEGLAHPAEEVLAAYARAAQLDASLALAAEEARRRLARPAPRSASSSLGPILVVMAVSAVVGWAWGLSRRERAAVSAAPRAPEGLPGRGILSPKAALAALVEAARSLRDDPQARLSLAESLFERLTGRPAFSSDLDRRLGRRSAVPEGALPPGGEAFFARALDPDPARRFGSAAELVGAFRAVVDPPVL